MKKQIGFLLVMLVMLLTVSAAMADNVRTSGLYTYEIKGNGTAVITGFDWKSNLDQDIYVPSMIDGYVVTTIGKEAFSTDRTSVPVVVTLPDTVTTLEEKAFFQAPVSKINITQNLRTIGSGALTTQKEVLFNLAPNQQWFAIIDNALYEKSTKKLIAIDRTKKWLRIPEGIKIIGAYSCYCSRESGSDFASISIYVPQSVTTIEAYAFANSSLSCDYDSAGYGFEGIQELGEGCFQDVAFYEDFCLPEGITEIPAYAFEKSLFFETLNLPNSIEKLGAYAFCSAAFLLDYDAPITLPDSLKEIGEYCFYSSDREYSILGSSELVFPDTTQKIADYAFAGCNVSKYTLPDSITKIGSDAFDREKVTLVVEQNSYAESFAQEWGYNYQYTDVEEDLSWLNN